MANHQHLEVLNRGDDFWNKWRSQNASITPDFRGADLRRKSLRNYDLSRCDLSGADARDVSFRKTKLGGANFNGAQLHRAFFSGSDVRKASFRRAVLYETIFANVDLSTALELSTCTHKGPSVLDHRTLARSRSIAIEFLQGCGLPDSLIVEARQTKSRLRDYRSCFISYSSKDQEFADRLHKDLQAHGVRCWFAPKDMLIGAKIRDALDEAIRETGKVLLILSSHSLASGWVEKEFETTFEEEQRRGEDVLFPIRLDDSPFANTKSWIADIRRSRNIGDFSSWREDAHYRSSFDRLLNALAMPSGAASP